MIQFLLFILFPPMFAIIRPLVLTGILAPAAIVGCLLPSIGVRRLGGQIAA